MNTLSSYSKKAKIFFMHASAFVALLLHTAIPVKAEVSDHNGKGLPNIDHSGWLSFLSKDIGTIGTLADRNPVMQVYINSTFDNRIYTSLWANIPLDPSNESRSTEFDFSVGYVFQSGDYKYDFSLALFDLQNPSIGDFDNDIITTKFRVDRKNVHFEISHYEGINAQNGWLTAVGYHHSFSERLSLSSTVSYTTGPFNFDAVAFFHTKMTYKFKTGKMAYFAEFVDQLYRENPLDPRRSTMLLGVRRDFN